MPEPGIYLCNATGELTPLATEGGGGDRELLEEALQEHTEDGEDDKNNPSDLVASGVTEDDLKATERTLRKFKATAIDEWNECPQWILTALYAVQRERVRERDGVVLIDAEKNPTLGEAIDGPVTAEEVQQSLMSLNSVARTIGEDMDTFDPWFTVMDYAHRNWDTPVLKLESTEEPNE